MNNYTTSFFSLQHYLAKNYDCYNDFCFDAKKAYQILETLCSQIEFFFLEL